MLPGHALFMRAAHHGELSIMELYSKWYPKELRWAHHLWALELASKAVHQPVMLLVFRYLAPRTSALGIFPKAVPKTASWMIFGVQPDI